MTPQPKSPFPAANPRGNSAWLAGGIAAVVVASGFGWQATRTSDLEKQIADANQQKATLQARLDQTDTSWQNAIKAVQQELDETREQNKTIVTKADVNARRRADAVAKKQQAANEQL